jgi:AcrR family transcriptional regulator
MRDRAPNPLHERFIQTAWQLGASEGYAGVKIRAIADAVGVSSALLYSYFEDKAALMDELRGRGCAILDAELERAMQRARGLAGVEALCRGYLGYMAEHAWLYLGESKRELIGPTAPHAEVFIRRLSALLGERGDEHAPSPNPALHLWLALQGVIALMRALGTWDAAFVESHLRLLLLGFASQCPIPEQPDDEDESPVIDAAMIFARA